MVELCGMQNYNRDTKWDFTNQTLSKYVKLTNLFSETPAVKMFWNILSNFNIKQQRDFIRFVFLSFEIDNEKHFSDWILREYSTK